MAVLSTESVTNRCPQTASSKAFFVTSIRGVRASTQSTANGFGASGTGSPAQVSLASASSSSNWSKLSRVSQTFGIHAIAPSSENNVMVQKLSARRRVRHCLGVHHCYSQGFDDWPTA
jgi:hypothetical protein